MKKKKKLGLFLFGLMAFYVVIWKIQFKFKQLPDYWFAYRRNFSLIDDSPRSAKYVNIKNDMEAVIRLTFNDKLLSRFYCDMVRSSVVYWNSTLLGNFLLIFDEKDRKYSPSFISKLNKLPSNSFRAYHEKPPRNIDKFKIVGEEIGKSVGYMTQLYSSFFMDLYTDKSIIAWIDTDSVFTIPVLAENIMNAENQLIVKGMNTFREHQWIQRWDRTTKNALGLTQAADFMTYFPVFVYTRTIRKCREYILRRFKTNDFEEAFLKFTDDYLSPVSIILSYAYYFERDLYEWHIDIGDTSLAGYNQNRLDCHLLEMMDITPELHLTVHSGYSNKIPPPLERALCYTRISAQTSLPEHCLEYLAKDNRQPFEFQDKEGTIENHFDTWCSGKTNKKCNEMIEYQYRLFWKECKQGLRTFTPELVRDVEKSARSMEIICSEIRI